MNGVIFDIVNPIKLKQSTSLNIDSIVLNNDVYYIKSTDNEYYEIDRILLRRMCLFDRSGLCAKAFRQLKNKQLITMDGIVDIDDINIINKELTEVDKLIREGIFIPKEYRTPPKQDEVLYETFKDVLVDVEQKILAKDRNHPWSREYLNKISNKITDEQYKIAMEMTKIMHLLLSVDLKNMFADDLYAVSKVIDFIDFAKYETKGIDIPKVLRLSEETILNLIDKYIMLCEELNNI